MDKSLKMYKIYTIVHRTGSAIIQRLFFFAFFALTVSLLLFSSIPLSAQESQADQTYSLVVASNIEGAQVFIGEELLGTTDLSTTIKRGRIVITVAYPGYQSYIKTVEITKATRIFANLIPLIHTLSIADTIYGGQVFINDEPAGTMPLTVQLPPGEYKITIKADGYTTFSKTVTLMADHILSPVMTPLYSTIRFTLPEDQTDTERAPFSACRTIFSIDGTTAVIGAHQIIPGFHTIRMIVGELILEQVIQCLPGATYTISPNLYFNISSSQ